MKSKSPRQQDRSTTKVRMAAKKERLMKLCIREGKTVRQASKILKAEGFIKGVSKTRLGADLQTMSRDAPKNVETARQEAEVELRAMKNFVFEAEDLNSKETVDSLLSIHDRIARLLGLDAPAKSVSATIDATVDPATLVGYRKFRVVTSNMDPATLEQVYRFAEKLNAAPAPRTILPPLRSELWGDEPEPEPKRLASAPAARRKGKRP